MTPNKKISVMDDYLTMQAISSFNNSLAQNANVLLASQTSKQDRKFSREMSDLAWQRNIEAWNMQNEYNLPVNQYARQLEGLRANGLNPNMVYGNSSAVGGAAGSVNPYRFDSYHSTAVPRFGNIDPVQNILSTRLLQTQVAAQEAQTRLINARADNEVYRSGSILSRSNEAQARWNYIVNHMDDQEQAWRALQSLDYWKGQQAFSTAEILKNKASMSYIEAAMAEWLNTAIVPGTQFTYRQYMEQYKALIPQAQWENFKASTLNFASQMAYRKKQGELVDLKIEYQRYVNQFAKYGRAIGGDWITTLLAGLYQLLGGDPIELAKDAINKVGQTQSDIPSTYPGP